MEKELTREECLELENFELKLGQVQMMRDALLARKKVWRQAVEGKYQINLDQFQINLETGVLSPRG